MIDNILGVQKMNLPGLFAWDVLFEIALFFTVGINGIFNDFDLFYMNFSLSCSKMGAQSKNTYENLTTISWQEQKNGSDKRQEFLGFCGETFDRASD